MVLRVNVGSKTKVDRVMIDLDICPLDSRIIDGIYYIDLNDLDAVILRDRVEEDIKRVQEL